MKNNKFYQLNKDLLRISKLRKKPWAILLYTAMIDLLQLSEKSGNKYKNANGDYYVLYTADRAKTELGICPKTFNEMKKLLRETGLIYWDMQETKTSGVSVKTYIKKSISHLCDIEELIYNAPKTSNTDDTTIEPVKIEENVVETKEPTTINADVLEMIKSLQADMKKLQSENKKMKNEINSLKSENEEIKSTLKEMQSVSIVAPVNEVVEEIIIDNENNAKNEADSILNIEPVQAPTEMVFGHGLLNLQAVKSENSEKQGEKVEETKEPVLAFGKKLNHVFTEEEKKSTKGNAVEIIQTHCDYSATNNNTWLNEPTVKEEKKMTVDDFIENVEKKSKMLSLDDIEETPKRIETYIPPKTNKDIVIDPIGIKCPF